MRFAAAVLSLILAAPAALAADEWTLSSIEPDQSSWGFTPARAPIAQSHIDHYAQVLALDDQQKAALDSLLETLAGQYKQAWIVHAEATADLNAKMRITQSWQDQQGEMAELTEKFRRERLNLLGTFFEDMRLFLLPEQEKRWDIVERDRRRVTTLVQFACFDDESIDLVAAVEALNISDDERAALEPILDRYAESLDPVLAARNRKSESIADTVREYQRLQRTAYSPAPDSDPQDMVKAQQKLQEKQASIVPDALELRDASARVRDVNHQFMDELTKAIPPAALDDWKKVTKPAKRSRNFWESYSRADMLFKTLENLEQMVNMAETQMQLWDSDQANEYLLLVRSVEPLSPDQRHEVEAIHDEFTGVMERLEREHRPASAADPEDRSASIPTPAGTIHITKVDPDAPDANPYAFSNQQQQDPEYAKRRGEVEQGAIDRVRKVLSTNQRAMVARY